MKDAQNSIFKAKYGVDMNLSDDEDDEDNNLGQRKEDRPKEVRVELKTLFPEIKPESECKI